MRSFSKVLTIAALIIGVLLAGIAVGWLATQRSMPEMPLPKASSPPPKLTGTGPIEVHPSNAPRRTATATNAAPASSVTATNLITDWEDRLEQILGSEVAEAEKAKQLLVMFPRLPQDGQVEVANHLSNLLSDQEYAPLGKFLVDPKTPEPVEEVLLADVLNRPNSLKLPLLLEIARNAGHPKAEEAKDLLELYLESDFGKDWNLWQTKMQQWLKDNPD